MPWSRATLVHAVTTATGTNNYALQDPAGAGPYRTDVQANADGSLANGATVHYEVRDTTVTGDASFERGYGVYTLATRTIARTAGNVLDGSSGPGVLVSWGLSGQRDVIILEALDGSEIPDAAAFATTLGLPRLPVSNTFALTADADFLQKVQNPSTGTSASAGFQALSDAATFTLVAHAAAKTTSRFGGAVGGRSEVLGVAGGINIGTLGANSVRLGTAGVTRLELTGAGVVQDGSGNKFVAFPTGGTVKMLFSSAPPSGWTRVNETNQAIIRLATAADTPNASGGSDSFFDGAWSTVGHTLTESQIPAHTHNVNKLQIGQGGANLFTVFQGGGTTDTTSSTGGGGSHSHAMTTPHYRIACWATYD